MCFHLLNHICGFLDSFIIFLPPRKMVCIVTHLVNREHAEPALTTGMHWPICAAAFVGASHLFPLTAALPSDVALVTHHAYSGLFSAWLHSPGGSCWAEGSPKARCGGGEGSCPLCLCAWFALGFVDPVLWREAAALWNEEQSIHFACSAAQDRTKGTQAVQEATGVSATSALVYTASFTSKFNAEQHELLNEKWM